MKKVRLGVVGLGRGLNAARNVFHEDDVIIGAICDRDEVMLRAAENARQRQIR